MERGAFTYLFIHANSLAELALDALAASLDADMEEQGDPYAAMSADEREALALAQLAKMDASGMQDGFAWETPEHDAQVQSSLAQLEQQAETPEGPATAETPDLDVYLTRAYAARDVLAERIDAAMARVDHAALERLVAGLPADLAPLTQALDGQQFSLWLACHLDGNAALGDLVAQLV